MRPLALTLGEPAGIGPELTLQLWAKRNALGVPTFVAVGDPELLAERSRSIGLDVPIETCATTDAPRLFSSALPVLNTGVRATAKPGKPDQTSAQAAIAAIEKSVDCVFRKEVSAVVTNPIAKSVMYEEGFKFPGHTEFLADLASTHSGKLLRPVMLIWSEQLSVVPVTIHLPIKDVAKELTSSLIVETGRIVARDFIRRFGITHPRLAVCGLNPHAGEHGTLGREDIEVIVPAVQQLMKEGISAKGPFPADTLFHAEARNAYDVVLGMYHDQVLAPIKAIAFDSAVNITLGLPFIRTSPDHGTAFDIAGKGTANPASLLAALKIAQKLSDTEQSSR